MYAIEDQTHGQHVSLLETRAQAHAELRRLAHIPWNRPPHRCTCPNRRNCGRRYHIVQYETSATPWRKLADEAALEVSREGIVWLNREDSAA